jgi:hypothetical protein
VIGDFNSYNAEPFDYAIVMGVMDYVADPKPLIAKVHSLTRERAFFSFPAAGGVLGWQRRLRYRDRCPLFLYTRSQVEKLFEGIEGASAHIEPIARDYFVQLTTTKGPEKPR